MIIGAVVGFILGYLVQEKVTGKNYGAGQWQRPKDKQFVGDVEAFFRWLAFPILTAAGERTLPRGRHPTAHG